MRRRWTAGFCALVFMLALAVAAGSGGVRSQSAPDDASPVASPAASSAVAIRQTLAVSWPDGAPGQTLELVQHTIPPQTTLAIHIHPGVQLAVIVSGELTYHVLSGTIEVGRAENATESGPGSTEPLAAGESTVLRPGDWVIETPDGVHYGENLGDEPVIILAATLLTTGEPSAIRVNPEGTPVAP